MPPRADAVPVRSPGCGSTCGQHLRHALECSISLWVWQSLLLNVQRVEPDLTLAQCLRNLVLHFFMSDALFFWENDLRKIEVRG